MSPGSQAFCTRFYLQNGNHGILTPSLPVKDLRRSPSRCSRAFGCLVVTLDGQQFQFLSSLEVIRLMLPRRRVQTSKTSKQPMHCNAGPTAWSPKCQLLPNRLWGLTGITYVWLGGINRYGDHIKYLLNKNYPINKNVNYVLLMIQLLYFLLPVLYTAKACGRGVNSVTTEEMAEMCAIHPCTQH